MLKFPVILLLFVYLCVDCLVDEVASEKENDVCHRRLGMEDGTIQDLDITSSSVATLVGIWWPWYARLNGDFAWLPHLYLTTASWIQVDLKELKTVTGVITQGYDGPHQKYWITTYHILYLDTSLSWDIIRDEESATTFIGNTDAAGQKTNMFDRPIVTRLIRLQPATWDGLPALRMELLGCDFIGPIGPAEVASPPSNSLPYADTRTGQPTSSAQASTASKNGASIGRTVAAGVATLIIKILYGSLAPSWHW